MRRIIGTAVAMTVVIAAAGCSGGSSTGSDTSADVGPVASARAGRPPDIPTESYAAALSHPATDSYYPQHGVPYLDTLHYGLDLDWRATPKRLTGIATIDFRVTTARSTVRFELGAPLAVHSVELDGRRVTSRHTGNHLTIKTGAVKGNSRHTAVIAYAGTPALVNEPGKRSDLQSDGFHIGSDGSAWTFQEPYGAFTWYPVNDEPSDKAYYDAKLTAYDGQEGVFNGQLTSTVETGRTVISSFHLAEPAASYLTTVAFGKYQHQLVSGPHGLPVNYWYTADDVGALPMIRKTPDMIGWIEGILGRYPFASAGYLLVPGDSGMETQSLVTFSYGPGFTLDRTDFEGDVVHELIHQWLGDEITPTDWRDVWLNEGLTMYLQYRYLAEHGLISETRLYAALQHGQDQVLRDASGSPGKYHRDDFANRNVYDCGALLLYNLENAYGRTKLDAALKGWPATAKYGNSDRARFAAYLSKSLGPKAGPYVTNWLTASHTPAQLPKQP